MTERVAVERLDADQLRSKLSKTNRIGDMFLLRNYAVRLGSSVRTVPAPTAMAGIDDIAHNVLAGLFRGDPFRLFILVAVNPSGW